MDRNFTITIWKENKHYVAQCLDVDVSSFGDSFEDATKNIKEAIELYLEDADLENIPSVQTPALTITTVKLHA